MARIRAERELHRAIERAEVRYQETAEIGERFDHALALTKRKLARRRS